MMKLFHAIADLLFPAKCVLCGKLLEKEETDLCHTCRKENDSFPKPKTRLPFLENWTALWYYSENVRRSILRFKFRNCRSYADVYGRLLAMKLQQEYPEGFEILTWIPISSLRRLKRGYDQVELIARAVSRELGIEAVPLLKKIRNNPPQSGISGEAKRRANVLGVYQVQNREQIVGKRILLLDDIVTTGATAGEASRVLLTAGAREVTFAAVAAASHQRKT